MSEFSLKGLRKCQIKFFKFNLHVVRTSQLEAALVRDFVLEQIQQIMLRCGTCKSGLLGKTKISVIEIRSKEFGTINGKKRLTE